ncbi:MAG: NIL domain-containing protein [bacterium]
MGKRRVFLSGPAEMIKEPIMYHLVKNFDIVPNVRRANVLEKEAWMILELEAQSETVLDSGIGYLKEIGASVQSLEGDVLES